MIVVAVTVVAIVVLFILVHCMRETRESYKDDMLNHLVERLRTVTPVVEGLNFYEGEKSYTINKKDVYICMRDEHGEYYDPNFLTFVILHEISHALCDEIGHTPKFMDIFEQVLQRAAQLGIYDPDAPKIANYCNYRKE